MTQWVAFAAIVTLLTAAMVWLSLLTQRSITPIHADSSGNSTEASRSAESNEAQRTTATPPGSDDDTARAVDDARPTGPNQREDDAESGRNGFGSDADVPVSEADLAPNGEQGSSRRRSQRPLESSGRVVASVGGEPVTTSGLLVNVTITQTLFLGLVLVTLVLADVPIGVLGIEFSTAALGSEFALGLGAGLGLYGASEVGSELGRRFGVDHDEWLRESLAPSSPRGWAGLFVGVLPLIAVFEELLFRGVLIGAFGAGFGLSPWVLAVVSSLVFAVGHGIQGTAGIVVTGVIGFVLAALFVVTGSLLTVVVAHYVLNACEFVVHELLDLAPPAIC